MNMSCKNHFKLQNSKTASWLKIQVDSIFLGDLYRPISSLQKVQKCKVKVKSENTK